MEFLKKNYEKVLLAVVLIGGTIVICALPFIISSKRNALDNMIYTQVPHVKELPKLDMAVEDMSLQRAQAPFALDYTSKHNLFNPVTWKKLADGRLLKEISGSEEGPEALEVTNIKPLLLEIKLTGPSTTGYSLSIQRDAAPREDLRHRSSFISKEHNTDMLTLLEIKGPPEKPTQLIFEWNEAGDMKGDTITVGADKPFSKIEAYAADLKYAPENKTWTDRRVGNQINFANAKYKIVAISPTNVVVLAESNNKKTTRPFLPANQPR